MAKVTTKIYFLREGEVVINIVFTAKLSEKHQASLQEKFVQHHFSFYSKMKEVPEQTLHDAHILATYGSDMNTTLLEQMPNLQWIQVLSAGLEKMPLPELQKKHVIVTNARGIHAIQMAEYTFAAILNIVRRGYTFYDNQKQGIWDTNIHVDEAYGKTIGILGLGAIGTEIAKRAKAFGMNVLALRRHKGEAPDYVDQLISYEERATLFRESDFLVILLPVTAETVRFVGEEELRQMKRSAYFINLARGQVVDEQALITCLKEEVIAGAVLDVFEEEPLPSESPLWNLPNVIITPHISGRSPHYISRALAIFEENLKLYPDTASFRNRIDLERGY